MVEMFLQAEIGTCASWQCTQRRRSAIPEIAQPLSPRPTAFSLVSVKDSSTPTAPCSNHFFQNISIFPDQNKRPCFHSLSDMSRIFGDGFARHDTGWKPVPSHRGTYNILSTCFVTLGLCIWTMIHLNIPEYRASWRRQVWRKLGWMALGFIAPELVAFTAFQQHTAARSLTRQMRIHFPIDYKRKPVKSQGGS